jgi:histidine triad (HIT) family protein
MSLDGAYDETNVFAKILRGEIPSVPVFEDDQVLVFMDAFPQAKGHMLVVSKTSKARNLMEAEPKALGRMIGAVQKACLAARAALKPDGIVVTQFNGAPAGQTVFHLHFHVIPRWEDAAQAEHGSSMASPDDVKALADQIRAAWPKQL